MVGGRHVAIGKCRRACASSLATWLPLLILLACAPAMFAGGRYAHGATGANFSSTQLKIVTSYPPAFFDIFKAAFEKANPGLVIVAIHRNTASGVRMIQQRPGFDADMFWASAPDAFEVLKELRQLRRVKARNTGAPSHIMGYPVNDPDGQYLGFALSGYGFVYSPSYLATHGLPVPETWSELTSPVYSGHIGISSPSRSGTTHLIVEAILQTHGWDRGWALLSRLGGNLSTVTARSFGVPSGVANGRFGIGISIDFLASAKSGADGTTKFILPKDTIFVPACIAILARSKNSSAAEKFVDFVLSEEGQRLLLDPRIDRTPVVPDLQSDTTAGRADLTGTPGLMNGRMFDAGLSARRYQMVNLLFDEFVVRKRGVLARLWRRIGKAEGQGLDAAAQARVGVAVSALTEAPVPEAAALDRSDRLQLDRRPTSLAGSAEQAKFLSMLHSTVEQRLRRAEEALGDIGQTVNDPELLR